MENVKLYTDWTQKYLNLENSVYLEVCSQVHNDSLKLAQLHIVRGDRLLPENPIAEIVLEQVDD